MNAFPRLLLMAAISMLFAMITTQCGFFEPREQFYVVNAKVTSSLNARDEPTTSSPAKFRLRAGDIVAHYAKPIGSNERTVVKGPKYTWRYISRIGYHGWVASEYLDGPYSKAKAKEVSTGLNRRSVSSPKVIGAKFASKPDPREWILFLDKTNCQASMNDCQSFKTIDCTYKLAGDKITISLANKSWAEFSQKTAGELIYTRGHFFSCGQQFGAKFQIR